VGLELLEGAEGVLDGLGELSLGLASAIGGEVLPEHGVVGVAAQIEGEVLLPQVDRAEVPRVAGGGQCLQGGVGPGDVGGVVLVVVELHDPPGDVRLKGGVVVGELGKRVHGHDGCLSWVGRERSRVRCADGHIDVSRLHGQDLLYALIFGSDRCGPVITLTAETLRLSWRTV